MIKSLFKAFRVKHYLKNIVVFIPLVFSLKFSDLKLTTLSIVAFVAFSLIASAVYVFNDIFDAEKDKIHPIKKNRPIASGEINVSLAWCVFVILALLSFVLALTINKYVFASVFAYLLLNLLYTYKLKTTPIVDVVCIAFGFILRVLAGCGAILVAPSLLVILLKFFTSLFFTFAKRKLEFALISQNNCRASIKCYNERLLNHLVRINAILSVVFYVAYVQAVNANAKFLIISAIPFAILIFRLLFLTHTSKNNDDPANFIYKDKTTKIILLLYFVILALVLIIH